jgi:hypothetical protein
VGSPIFLFLVVLMICSLSLSSREWVKGIKMLRNSEVLDKP